MSNNKIQIFFQDSLQQIEDSITEVVCKQEVYTLFCKNEKVLVTIFLCLYYFGSLYLKSRRFSELQSSMESIIKRGREIYIDCKEYYYTDII